MEKINIGGWKTKTAAAGLILIGAGSVLQGASQMLDGDFEGGMAVAKGGVLSVSTGLGLLGIGHKIEKAKAA
jgi:hypothetical protein